MCVKKIIIFLNTHIPFYHFFLAILLLFQLSLHIIIIVHIIYPLT